MQVSDPQFRNRCLIYTGLALVTFALYLPALHNGFVEYDDQQYVTDNPLVQSGLTWHGVVWAFGFHAGNWHPLAWLSHMLDCQLFAARAWGHHLTSIVLHTGTTLLLFAVLRRMTGRLWPSAAVAALFAWHPLHVESVAWVAERKDVLCAFFWMLTLWCYARYVERSSAVRYLVTLGAFALCLMAKPMAVTLPFVLLLLDFWPLGRKAPTCSVEIARDFKKVSATSPQPSPPLHGGEGARGVRFKKDFDKAAPTANSQQPTLSSQIKSVTGDGWRVRRLGQLIVEKVPFLVLSAIACALTLQAQHIAIVSTAGLPMAQRIPHTMVAYNHYFWAMFFPHHLAVYYPYVLELEPGMVIFSGLVLLIVTVLAVIHFRQRPFILMGWLWFLGTLIPVIGLVQVGDQAWADRYTYLPLIGLFVAVVWLGTEAVKNKKVLSLLAVITGAAMLAATSIQLSYWKNTWTLFDHTNKVTKENYMAITVLASQLAQQNKLEEAMALYHTALRYKPTFPETHFFLGNAFDQLGQPDEAVAEYEKALWFKPMQEQTHVFLGIVLGKQKKYAEAITNYQAALAIDPESAVTHNNLARIYHTQGRFDEAMEHYQAALKINPRLSLAQNNLGILLLQKSDFAGGTLHLREALRLNPTNSETQFNLALALNQQQQWGEAAELFAKTVTARSTDPKAHFEYATALTHTQKTREAMGEYAAALLSQPDYPDALAGLAWILSTATNADFRNGIQAVPMAERACVLTARKDAEKLKTLAAAYAEAGRFSDATATTQEAQDVAIRAGQKDLAEACRPMLENFKSGKPWR